MEESHSVIVLEKHWIVKLKGARKFHLAATDSDGRPVLMTLCKKAYELEERLSASRGGELSGSECAACVGLIRKATNELYALGLVQHLSPAESSRRATSAVGIWIGE